MLKVHWSYRASIPLQQGGQPQVQRGAGQGDADGQAHGQVRARTKNLFGIQTETRQGCVLQEL